VATIYLEMKAATIKQLKDELKECPNEQLIEYCLRLARFKKENKELLTYLLFEAEDEKGYVQTVKELVDDHFDLINRTNLYLIKKGIRKILREIKKFIRYSNQKETEVQLLLYFCEKLKNFTPSVYRSTVLQNLYDRQIAMIRKKVTALHEDLQYDYGLELEKLA
jgi:hypothetical protein